MNRDEILDMLRESLTLDIRGDFMKPAYSKEFPKTHLMNPAKPYVNALKTDIRETFRLAREKQEANKGANRDR